jgi:hypothetical protein
MSESLTLEEVEHIVDRLSTYDKLKLISYIGENLSISMLQQDNEELMKQENSDRIKAFLEIRAKMKVKTIGKTDSVEDIRQIREERMARFD